MKTDFLKRLAGLLLAFVLLCTMIPAAFATERMDASEVTAETEAGEKTVEVTALYNAIPVFPGQLLPQGEVVESDIYGYVMNYSLKKGHTLSISNTDYVFSVRMLDNANYNTILKQATVDTFTATKDMTVGMLIRKPDKSPVSPEELAAIVIHDSQLGMVGVEGSVARFTVNAEAIDGSSVATRCIVVFPDSYKETGAATPIVMHVHGRTGYVGENDWCANAETHRQLIENYLSAGYAVFDVDNTEKDTASADLGCPQLVSAYREAYEYIQANLNVEEKFSIHSRSFGTYAAIRIMREMPDKVKCAIMAGPWVSMEAIYGYSAYRKDIAVKFGFDDITGNTYEEEKLVGYDPYTDIDGVGYWLPPTFWMMAENDANATAMHPDAEIFISKLNDLGCVTKKATYNTDHTGVCTLNSSEMRSAAMAFLTEYQEDTGEHRLGAWEVIKEATCKEAGQMRRYCADCEYYETKEVSALSGHIFEKNENICNICGTVFDTVCKELTLVPGQFYDSTGEWVASDVYGCVIGYELKAGHTLSINNLNYVFSVRVLENGNYSTMLKAATTDSFTAKEDMTIAVRVRKPDKSAITEEALAGVVLYDSYKVEHIHTYENGTCTGCNVTANVKITDEQGNTLDYFTSLPQALSAATSGQTVCLRMDVTEDDITVLPGVSLDLNGCTLTVSSVLTYSGSQILDSSENTDGLLKFTDTDGNMISKTNSQLPVYDKENGGYRFFAVSVTSVAVTDRNGTAPKYWFKIEAQMSERFCALIQSGAEVLIQAKMTWDGQEVYAIAEQAFTKIWAQKNATYITVSVEGAKNLEDFVLTPCIASGGVELPGEEMK